jgi:NADH:ubiquinone oxidoreductase subunit F (NADH-binding)
MIKESRKKIKIDINETLFGVESIISNPYSKELSEEEKYYIRTYVKDKGVQALSKVLKIGRRKIVRFIKEENLIS